MIGDKLVIKKKHTERAMDICDVVVSKYTSPYVITVAGESGTGKSETAFEICRILLGKGIKAAVIQQDDYFVFPPKTNHLMRMNNREQVGPFEVKLDFLDSNLRSFKKGENPIYKPLVDYDKDLLLSEELDVSGVRILIVEGTYTSLLRYADFRIFLDGNFRETLGSRNERNREKYDPFLEEILEKEHEIITTHWDMADIRISSDFKNIILKQTGLKKQQTGV
ncbi:MAG: hypothetical protein HQ557_16530 [Bacteroidetes bacterium]|nr:hypothetical protein [Bacteroidota bacterium]